MRTLFISDIHIDVNEAYDVIGILAEYSRQKKVECIILAGDISEDIGKTLPAIEILEKLSGAEVLYVPGNHDMWEPCKDNDKIYERYCADRHCLCGKPRRIGNHMVIGDIGWYDYSFGSDKYTDADFDRMEFEGRTWNDKKRNYWTDDNKAKSQWFIDRIESQMKDCGDLPIVVITHMLPNRRFIVPPEEFTNINWHYFNAFLGTPKLGEMYQKYNVKYAVCGHVHFRDDYVENGIVYLCRCLNYAREWLGEKNCLKQIMDAAEIIDL